MARRYNSRDLEGAERPTSGPMALAGLIKLQSGRNRKGNKVWRPLQPSDLGGDDHMGEIETDNPSVQPDLSDFAPLLGPPHPSSAQLDPYFDFSAFNLPKIQTDMAARVQSSEQDTVNAALPNDIHSAFASEGSEGISPTDIRIGVVENYQRLFGKLPDLIRLHEQTGDFDGQIVFIGHPNRDVSAHQWSSAGFQWINIGSWSHNRAKIEGSLASDRIPDSGFSYDTVEYFKFVAERQEALIKEHGRQNQRQDTTEMRPALTPAEGTGSLSSASGSPNEAFVTLQYANGIQQTIEGDAFAHSSSRNVTGERLEDPFVTPSKPPRPAIPPSLTFRGNGSGTIGSMNFNYEFPVKPAATAGVFSSLRPTTDPQQVYIQRERERLEVIRRGGELLGSRETPRQLREVGFGEEASSMLANSATRESLSRVQAPLSPEDIHNRMRLKNRLAELGDQVRRPSLGAEHRVAIPEVPMLNTNIRALFPPGPTVANPYRGISTLNANAPSYCMPGAGYHVEDSGSDMTAVNAPPVANLQFSDPDGVRQSHVHEIANGLNQQAPTRQNFNGPFFADSMPTTHDPTALLTVQVSDEEKLLNWFRDGQRPARQQEYANSLMAAAPTTSKGRSLGVIGEGATKAHNRTQLENTPLFVRVYENLFEYAEESRAGGSFNYFTRAWKPAPSHMCDLGPDGNNSFFGGAASKSSQVHRVANRGYPTFQSSPWGRAGGYTNSLLAAKFRHGVVADGGFGRPVA